MTHHFEYEDTGYTPFNSRFGEKKGARATVEITDYDGSKSNPRPWLEIKVDEYIPDKNGNIRTKTICVVLPESDRARLLATLTKASEEPSK